ncbi:MAG: 50S ribosomal protein L4 [Firmicutes bacterium]|nr:50S ribosomal protein L4 [Bacillota bacterium]
MPKTTLYNIQAEKVGEIELSDSLFGSEVNVAVMHAMVKNHLANCRQGTQSTKTRTEVRGGGRKPWRQKGTGRARQGSIRAPQWTGGGVALGPKPRSYRFDVNKKMRIVALKSALSAKVLSNDIIVLENFDIDTHKTKEIAKILSGFDVDNALIVTADKNENVIKGAKNIPYIKTTLASNINVYDILKHSKFIVTKDAVAEIEEVYA